MLVTVNSLVSAPLKEVPVVPIAPFAAANGPSPFSL